MEIWLDVRSLVRFTQETERQFPFAASKAVNDLALETQDIQRRHDRSIFTARRGDWLDKNVKVGFATKQRVIATVAIVAPGDAGKSDILGKFERGGDKRSIGSHGLVAIPMQAKRSKAGVIPKEQRPKALQLRDTTPAGDKMLGKGRSRSFILQMANGERGIFQRVSSRSRDKRRLGRRLLGLDPNIILIYWLQPSVKIRPELRLTQHAHEVARRSWADRFTLRFAEAMRTAR